jgi:hypothetical protein
MDLPMRNSIRPRVLDVIAGAILALAASAAIAADDKPAGSGDPSFGSRTDKPDGSSALTIGRRLSSPWDTKVGTDVSLAAPAGTASSDTLMRNPASDRSSGVVWGNLTMQGVAPPGFDKTSIEARLDAGNDEGKLGATVSRSMPIDADLFRPIGHVAEQCLGQAIAGEQFARAAVTARTTLAEHSWLILGHGREHPPQRRSVRTTISAGAASSAGDSQWHNKLSVEQTLLGPLKLMTSVEDAGTQLPKKSITAGFKRTW